MPTARLDLERKLSDIIHAAMAEPGGVDEEDVETTLENLREEFCSDE
jgi:hypothetical protein